MAAGPSCGTGTVTITYGFAAKTGSLPTFITFNPTTAAISIGAASDYGTYSVIVTGTLPDGITS